jgi:integrase/recombinase XerD
MAGTVPFPKESGELTVDEAVEAFLGRDLTPNSYRSFSSDLGRLRKTFGARSVSTVTAGEITTYLSDLKGRDGGPASAETWNRHLGTINNLYNWLARQDEVDANPVDRVERKKKGERLPRAMTRDQLDAFFGRLKDLRERALFSLLHKSGLRVGEALGLNIEDLNLADGTIRVIGKGNAERVGYMSEKTTPLLRRYIRSRGKTKTGPLFVSRQGRLSYAMVRVMFNRCVDGMTNPDGTPVTIHQLRHTFGTERAGKMDALVLRDLMGHKSIRTTLRYAKVNGDRAKKAFKEFDRDQ